MSGVLAIIPARAGSKRIPGKNKRPFMGKPLIDWTIEAAVQVAGIEHTIVTTDDADILARSTLFPQVTFYSRPESLATDYSSSMDVIVDVMANAGRAYKHIMLLQPTSPLRDAGWIAKALHSYYAAGAKQMVSVRPCKEVPNLIVNENNGYIVPLLKDHMTKRSQDWGQMWVINGAIYISEWDYFLQKKSFLTDETKMFAMPESISVDIDTNEDWKIAESAAKDV